MQSDFADTFRGRRFLVVGGAGFIGSHIAEGLLAQGAKVVVLDDFSNGKRANLAGDAQSLELVQGDVRTFDFDSLGKLDGVFNEAARALLPSFVDPVTDMLVNTGGAIRLLEYTRKHDVKLVHASSGSVYGNPLKIPISEDHPLNPISPYGVSKQTSELYCSMYFRVYGSCRRAQVLQRLWTETDSERGDGCHPYLRLKVPPKDAPEGSLGDGKQTRDFLNVE